MKVVPLPARQQVLPGDNQDFLPETVSRSLWLTAQHTQEKNRDTFFRFVHCERSGKIRGLRRLDAQEPIF